MSTDNDDFQTETELEQRVREHTCINLLKKKGYAIFSTYEWNKRATISTIFTSICCIGMLLVVILIGMKL